MISKKHHRFLVTKANAHLVKHSGRVLLDHLIGTQKLLHAWGNVDDVCNAGLFHSIYGTARFRKKAWPISDRQPIRDLIGEHAERFVYAFCTADRPRAFFVYSETLCVPRETLRHLREIEAANLLEQGSRSKWLKHLRDSDISDTAKHAIDEQHANLSDRPQQMVEQTTADRQ